MRRAVLLFCALGAASCGDPVGFDVVAVSPIYGWVDGCTDVKVSGHGFDDDIAIQIGGEEVTEVVIPAGELDVGFYVTGFVTPNDGERSSGLADVTVTSGGETSVLTQGYYFEACPTPIHPEYAEFSTVPGELDTVIIHGCNLGEPFQARVRNTEDPTITATAELSSTCGTAQVQFDLPDVPDGEYAITLESEEGQQMYPGPCTDNTPCEDPVYITVGGAG